MQYLRVYNSELGGAIDLHPLHGADELPNNLKAARVIADYGYHIELLPCISETAMKERLKWLSDVPNRKNPDIRINNNFLGDIKTPNVDVAIKQSTINRCIYACGQQKVSIAIINLMGREYAIRDIKNGIIGALQPDRNKTIDEVWVITKGERLFQISRDLVFDESIYEDLNYL